MVENTKKEYKIIDFIIFTLKKMHYQSYKNGPYVLIICHHQPRNVVQLFMYSLVSKPTRCWKVRWGSCLSYVPLSGMHPIPGGADQAGGRGRGGGRGGGGGGGGGGPRTQHHLGGARRTLTFWMRFYICYTPHCTLLILKLFNRE